MLSFRRMSDKAISEMNFVETVNIIQPMWNRFNMGSGANRMTKTQVDNLRRCLEHYKQLGGDMEYFTQGSGRPNNCTIL